MDINVDNVYVYFRWNKTTRPSETPNAQGKKKVEVKSIAEIITAKSSVFLFYVLAQLSHYVPPQHNRIEYFKVIFNAMVTFLMLIAKRKIIFRLEYIEIDAKNVNNRFVRFYMVASFDFVH